ncbi:uncharacterized protein LOC110859137 isoform X2 [Folsomia candida]|uniref:uncharacterized protein LOC110859137 isoform X2 n=1 Tax=Folsomia candida TaxID=158441 RepID=UPI001604A26A|nr:uncharacterized protein LOC110859137 isoform X2 [Folsomia candida]
MAQPENIVSKLTNSVATSNILLGLQGFVAGAIVSGYTAYQKLELQRLVEIMDNIRDRLGSLEHNTATLGLDLDRIQNALHNVERSLEDYTISTTLEGIDILKESMKEALLLSNVAKLQISSLLRNMGKDLLDSKHSKNQLHENHVYTAVTGVASFGLYATVGLAPITIPIGFAAAYYSCRYKINENEARDNIAELNRLINNLYNYEINLKQMEIRMDSAMLDLKLFRVRINSNSWSNTVMCMTALAGVVVLVFAVNMYVLRNIIDRKPQVSQTPQPPTSDQSRTLRHSESPASSNSCLHAPRPQRTLASDLRAFRPIHRRPPQKLVPSDHHGLHPPLNLVPTDLRSLDLPYRRSRIYAIDLRYHALRPPTNVGPSDRHALQPPTNPVLSDLRRANLPSEAHKDYGRTLVQNLQKSQR